MASVVFFLLICCTSYVIGKSAHELENSLEENFKDSSVKGLGNEADGFVPWNDKQLGDTDADQGAQGLDAADRSSHGDSVLSKESDKEKSRQELLAYQSYAPNAVENEEETAGNFPDKTKLTSEDTESDQTRITAAGLESSKDDKNTDGIAAQRQQMGTTESTKGNKAADAPPLSNEYDETKQAIASNVQLTDEVDSQSVCYIRNCSWVQRRIHQRYPYTKRYHYHFRYPVKVRHPYRTIYACGKYLYRHYRVRVCKRVPHRRRVCPNGVSRQCRFQTTFRRICGYRWRSIYKKRFCTRTVYIFRTVYRYRWIWRYRTTYRYRYVIVRRYICTYTED